MKKVIGLGILLVLISCDTILGTPMNSLTSSSSVYAMIIPTETVRQDPLEVTEVQETSYGPQQLILPGVTLQTQPLHNEEYHHTSSSKKVWEVNGQVKETEESQENDGNLHQKQRWIDNDGKKHETDNWTTEDGSVYQCHKWEDNDGCVHQSHQVTKLNGSVSKKHFKKNKNGQVLEINDDVPALRSEEVPLILHNNPGKSVGGIRHAASCPLGSQQRH